MARAGVGIETAAKCDLRSRALAAIAWLAPPEDHSPEACFLRAYLDTVPKEAAHIHHLDRYLIDPLPSDLPLVQLMQELGLNRVEILSTSLAAAVESDLMIGRAIAKLQSPLGGSRPTLGLMAAAFSDFAEPGTDAFHAILTGTALNSGLLTLLNEGTPAAERTIALPMPLCLALSGHDSNWPGSVIGLGSIPPVPLPSVAVSEAGHQAAALAKNGNSILMVRSGSVSEGRAMVCHIAQKLGRKALFIEDSADLHGLAPWVVLRGLLPVFCFELAPGERQRLPQLPYYRGPIIALCGQEGSIEARGESVCSWTIGVPPLDDRQELWNAVLGDALLAEQLASKHRYGSGHIAHLSRVARHQSLLRGSEHPDERDLEEAAWTGEGAGLDGLAQPLRDHVPDEALVTTPILRAELDRLFLRCRVRENLASNLGASAVTRYRPGVRALFVGPSGTGKTLAAGWLATRLGIPIYRVDLAAITSKYIGETEKNLAQLLARAEHAEVVLLFDEADSLFAKRTDIRDANDRFANAQTNYLLQRIETFYGITILTSNSRARFDSAFARRLDAIVDFPLPGPDERRALWLSHLGNHHTLTAREINQLAATADLCGGNIRNAVLAAAIPARAESRAIELSDIAGGLASEYRKLGRQMPVELGH
jgi:ATPase family associated with various cellular activities (AAA)